MSTKVYDGYRIKKSNVNEVVCIINSISNDVRYFASSLAPKHFINKYVDIIDDITKQLYRNREFNSKELVVNRVIGDIEVHKYDSLIKAHVESEKFNLRSFLYRCYRFRHSLNTNSSFRDVVYDFNMYINLFGVSKSKYSYITIHFEKDEYQTIIDDYIKSGVIEKYDYYNNVDRPSDVSSREWNRRSKIWKEALNNIAFQHMMLSQHDHLLLSRSNKESEDLLPSIQERALNIAKDLFIDHYTNLLVKEAGGENISQSYHSAIVKSKSDEGIQIINEIANIVEPSIVELDINVISSLEIDKDFHKTIPKNEIKWKQLVF